MPWRLVYCIFDRHRPNPASVSWNGTQHVGKCRDCGREVRKSSRGYWKRVTAPAPAQED